MQLQMEAVLTRQEQDTQKLNALLDLVDVTKRYVGLLENNQRPKPKTFARVTHEMAQEGRAMFAAGLTVTDVQLHLNIGRGTAQRISSGQWSSHFADRVRAAKEHGHV